MICRDVVKPSEVRQDFFYEQCVIQVFNNSAPDAVFSAPCKQVTRSDNEIRLDFDGIRFDREVVINRARLIGADGIPISERDLEEPLSAHPMVIMLGYWILEFD